MKLTPIHARRLGSAGRSSVAARRLRQAPSPATGHRLERVCLGDTVDEDCQVGPPSAPLTATALTDVGNADLAAANLAAAVYQDVEQAEAAGYVSTLETLGCFEDPRRGGMGLHYTNEALMDAHPRRRRTRSAALRTRRPRRHHRPRRPRVHRANRCVDQAAPHRGCSDATSIDIPRCRCGSSTRGSGRTTRRGCSRTSTHVSGRAPTACPSSARTRRDACPHAAHIGVSASVLTGVATEAAATAPDGASVEILPPDEPWGGATRGDLDAAMVATSIHDAREHQPVHRHHRRTLRIPAIRVGLHPAWELRRRDRGANVCGRRGHGDLRVRGRWHVFHGRATAVLRADRGGTAGVRQRSRSTPM